MTPLCIVQITDTGYYSDARTIQMVRRIHVVKHLSHKYGTDPDHLTLKGLPPGEAKPTKEIINLYNVNPGLYALHMCNVRKDLATDTIKNWDLELRTWNNPAL